jgi:hypothetical protein
MKLLQPRLAPMPQRLLPNQELSMEWQKYWRKIEKFLVGSLQLL